MHLGYKFIETAATNSTVLSAILLDVVMAEFMSEDVCVIPKRYERIVWPPDEHMILVPSDRSVTCLQ